jgi:hypothetical protein
LFTACKKSDDNGQPTQPVEKEIFSGYAQKGPFINGSSVTISELKGNLDQTGKTYSTTISDNLGSFEQKNIELISQYVELKVDGYYFNEISGETSGAPITLYALTDIKDITSANVNVLTHLEKSRVEYLVKRGTNFSSAKQQAQKEVLAIFGFEPSETTSETLDLTADAKLLAISSILQGYLSVGDMMELMANIITDIKEDGKLDNMVLGSKLINNANAINISISAIRENLTEKYAELGINITVPDFESYVESFINSGLYQPTSFITYPATGLYGVNILSDDVTEVQLTNNGPGAPRFIGSMKADVPTGLSLTIVLSGGTWGYSTSPGPSNWTVSAYDNNTQSQKFTVTESGKISDLELAFLSTPPYITIEYYENGDTTPTKTKLLYFKE